MIRSVSDRISREASAAICASGSTAEDVGATVYGDGSDPSHETPCQWIGPDDVAGNDPREAGGHMDEQQRIGKSTEVIRHEHGRSVRRLAQRHHLDISVGQAHR